jgi:membrane protein implicated in regulation of membrane protease activity
MTEYFLSNMWQFWTLICIICLILELSTGGFFIICFSIGSVFSAVAAAMGLGIITQIILFVVFSALCIFVVRPFALKYLHKNKEDDRPSNADALMGREGTVSQTIEADGYGRVAIDGDDWKAKNKFAEEIPKGAKVKVVGRDSIIITVEKI